MTAVLPVAWRRTAASSTQARPVRGPAGTPMLLTTVSGSGLLLVLAFGPTLPLLPIRVVSLLLVAATVVLGLLVARSVRSRLHSVAFLLYVVICVFHVGLFVPPAVTGRLAAGFQQWGYTGGWYTEPSMSRAAVVVLDGLLGYATGVGLLTWLVPAVRAVRSGGPAERGEYRPKVAAAAGDVGTGLLGVGVVAWYLISVSTLGPGFMLGNYLGYLSATADQPLPMVYLVISVGTVLAAVRLRRRMGVVAIVAFAAFALPAFVIGLRVEVLIPLVAAVPVWCRDPRNRATLLRWSRPAARVLAAGVLVGLLLAISLVQQVRLTGLQGAADAPQHQVSALAALQEMGYTIRVVVTTQSWHQDLHEPFRYGSTYYTPLVRATQRVLGLRRLEADVDYGLMNVEIAQRVGPAGGSVIAEADHNFGVPGVIGVLALLGAVAAGVDRPRPSVWGSTAVGLFGLLALMHVRNSFAPLFAWGAAGLVAVAAAVVLSRLYRDPDRR